MRRNRWIQALGYAGLLGLTSAAAWAQAGPGPRPGFRPMVQGGPPMFDFMGGKTVTGAPYSAEVTFEHTQKLPDGNVIDQKNTAVVYRDGQGRTRVEENRPTPSGNPDQIIRITDPVARVGYVLDTSKKTARKFTLPPPRNGNKPQNAGAANNPNVTTQSLSPTSMDGLLVNGTQITRTIPAGRMGNSQPIQITTTRWYSPDLNIDLSTQTTDPLRGNSTTTISNISREPPAASLFEVPSDYTVVAGGLGPRFRRPPAPQQ